MTTKVGDRIAGWLSAWKYVLILGVLLAASLYLNYWQHTRALTAPLRAENAGLQRALDDSADLQAASREAAQRAITASNKVATQLEGAGKSYRAAMRAQPLTTDNCAPGQARVDATNQALGATPPEK